MKKMMWLSVVLVAMVVVLEMTQEQISNNMLLVVFAICSLIFSVNGATVAPNSEPKTNLLGEEEETVSARHLALEIKQVKDWILLQGNVAFSAAVSSQGSFAAKEIVKFDSVNTNIGKAYDKYTGIFTAPKPGLYGFHIHGLSMPNIGFYFTLYHDDVQLVLTHGQDCDNYNAGGNSVAVSVKSGERVYVKAHMPSSVYTYGNGGYFATFTGYLIAAEYNE